MKKMTLRLLPFILLLMSAMTVWAEEIDVRSLGAISLGASPRQIVTTADGQRIYILTTEAKVLMYEGNGRPQGVFDVDPAVTHITPQGANRLLLQIDSRQQMEMLQLDSLVSLSMEGAPTLGKAEAPVAIAVFDDFECPYCARTVPLLKQVLAAYPEQVKLVFKNFPLSSHKSARLAAATALAAQKQGKFWPLHDLLYENYNRLNPQKIRALAEQVGLDMEQLDKDQRDPQIQQRINTDLLEGNKAGVRGTPTIFINGRRLQQRSLQGFRQLIDVELAKLKPTKTDKE